MLFLRSLMAFLILPGTFAGLIPAYIVSRDPGKGDGFLPGVVPMFAGFVVLIWCIRDFYVAGKGTLAPWDPPRHLVTVGLYQFTRNPMYVGILLLLAGWSHLTFSLWLATYTVIIAFAFHLRVVLYEEPRLRTQFSEAWENYSSKAPRWWLRFSGNR